MKGQLSTGPTLSSFILFREGISNVGGFRLNFPKSGSDEQAMKLADIWIIENIRFISFKFI